MTLHSRKFAVIITSIASPNAVLRAIASQCLIDNEKKLFVIGDTKSPSNFFLEGSDFYSIDRQSKLGFSLCQHLPTRHYARKNLGYLQAWKEGYEIIVETDDDNMPINHFWDDRSKVVNAQIIDQSGWVNVYQLFSKEKIWPRGLPLEHLENANLIRKPDVLEACNSPIQQGLANENPDVDAVYRMTCKLPIDFIESNNVALSEGSWCPFNSQNTTWFKEAFPLLYLPSYCSFRMTDIWRSFIAQRILWTNGWKLAFHNATVTQQRNEHSLLKDFEDEIPGYLLNQKIITALNNLTLKTGTEFIFENLLTCYKMMVENKFITNEKELDLVVAWIEDCKGIRNQAF